MGGVVLPKDAKGDRSSTAFNKTVYSEMAKALGDDAFANAIKSEKDWRHQYVAYLDKLAKTLVDTAGQGTEQNAKALECLRLGLQQVRAMEFEDADKNYKPLDFALGAGSALFEPVRVVGTGACQTDIPLEYCGSFLQGSEIDAQCQTWASYGNMEPDCAEAIAKGAKNVGSLQGRCFVILGVSSELGPAKLLLQAGATVIAVARRKPDRWAPLISFARGTSGTLVFPVPKDKVPGDVVKASDSELAEHAGIDIIADAPSLATWVQQCIQEQATGPITICTYLYLDGEANLRVTAVSDYIIEQASKYGAGKVSFAWLSSCSTTHVMRKDAAAAQENNYANSTWVQQRTGTRQECESVTEGNLFHGFEVMQGPNYALSQSMRQWRAMLLHSAGFVVSAPITPMCRTESVCSNKTMAAALQGVAYIRPLEAFDPETCRAAMFFILISDLMEPVPELPSPFHLFTRKAFHSGLWRCGFLMSSLGVQTAMWGQLMPKLSS